MHRILPNLALLISVAAAGAARAHDLPISNMTIVPDEQAMHVELVLNVGELNFASEIDLDKDGRIDLAELDKLGDEIARRIVSFLAFRVDDRPVELQNCGIVPDLGAHHLTVRAHYDVDARTAAVALQSRLVALTQGSHVLEIVFQRPSGRQLARLDGHASTVLFEPPKTSVTDTSAEQSERPSPQTVQPGWLLLAVPATLILLVGGGLLLRSNKT